MKDTEKIHRASLAFLNSIGKVGHYLRIRIYKRRNQKKFIHRNLSNPLASYPIHDKIREWYTLYTSTQEQRCNYPKDGRKFAPLKNRFISAKKSPTRCIFTKSNKMNSSNTNASPEKSSKPLPATSGTQNIFLPGKALLEKSNMSSPSVTGNENDKEKSTAAIIQKLEETLAIWNSGKPTREAWRRYQVESRRLINELKWTKKNPKQILFSKTDSLDT